MAGVIESSPHEHTSSAKKTPLIPPPYTILVGFKRSCATFASGHRLPRAAAGKRTGVDRPQSHFVAPIRIHHPELVLAAAPRAEQDPGAVGRPRRVVVVG